MEYVLSSAEREFAEQNHNLVYAYLRKKKLEESDFYDVVIFAYLKAIRRYFINKNLCKYNFSTIAWRTMDAAVINEVKKKKSIFKSLEEPITKDGKVKIVDTLGCEDNFEEKIVYNELLNFIKPHLNIKELRTLQRKAEGYKHSDIAKAEGISCSGINQRLSKARNKLKLVLVKGGEG